MNGIAKCLRFVCRQTEEIVLMASQIIQKVLLYLFKVPVLEEIGYKPSRSLRMNGIAKYLNYGLRQIMCK